MLNHLHILKDGLIQVFSIKAIEVNLVIDGDIAG
jgi:hypothetical protein